MDAYLRNISVEAIGPAEARTYLDRGDTSHLDWRLVDRYVDDMVNGRWRYPGGVITQTAGLRLKDGHHRLQAVVQCGIPQIFIVVKNVPEGHPS